MHVREGRGRKERDGASYDDLHDESIGENLAKVTIFYS